VGAREPYIFSTCHALQGIRIRELGIDAAKGSKKKGTGGLLGKRRASWPLWRTTSGGEAGEKGTVTQKTWTFAARERGGK